MPAADAAPGGSTACSLVEGELGSANRAPSVASWSHATRRHTRSRFRLPEKPSHVTLDPETEAIVTTPVENRGLEADARSLNVHCIVKPRTASDWLGPVSRMLPASRVA